MGCAAREAGTYSAKGGCIPCKAGPFSLICRVRVWLVCEESFFARMVQASCTMCPSGTFSRRGAAACSLCKDGSLTGQGSAKCDECGEMSDGESTMWSLRVVRVLVDLGINKRSS